jgi:hypothetical protein
MADLDGPWTNRRSERRRRLDRLGLAPGSKIDETDRIDEVPSSLIQPNDRVSLEGATKCRPASLPGRHLGSGPSHRSWGHCRPFEGGEITAFGADDLGAYHARVLDSGACIVQAIHSVDVGMNRMRIASPIQNGICSR